MNTKIKVLIIEDSIAQSQRIASFLDRNKYQVHFAYSGKEALDFLLTDKPYFNLVLVDYHLPDINGIEIIKKVNETGIHYSFIFITADKTLDTVVKAMKAGASHFIQKNSELKDDLPPILEKVYADYLSKIAQVEIDNQLNILWAGIEQSGSTIVITDLEGNIEYANKRFTATTGYTLKEAKGQNPRILKSGDKPQKYYQELWNSITKGKTWKGEFINKRKNGELFYEEAIISPIKNKKDEIIKYMAVKDDITARKQIENELKVKNDQLYFDKLLLEQIINTIPNPMFVKDADLKYSLCNSSFAQNILSISKDEIIGKSVFDISPKQLADKYHISDLEVKNNELNYQEYESKVKFTDGTLHNIVFYKARLQNQDNSFAGIVGIMLDITQRKKHELELACSKESLKKAQEIGNIGHWDYDVLNDSMYMSEQMYKIYELDRETFKPSLAKIIALIHPEDRDLVVNSYKESFIQTPFFEITHKVITYNGNLKYIKDSVETFFDQNKKAIRIIGNVQDITDLKLQELALIENQQVINNYAQELEKQNNDKDRFISILAHDLRNPLGAMLGFSDLLSNNARKYSIDKIEKQAYIINQTANKTFELLEELLLWSKSQLGKLPFKPQNHLFEAICQKIIKDFKTNIKNIQIDCVANEPIHITADLNMFKTIVRNLVSNAIKFTNPYGAITLSATKEHDKAIITVSDTGVGIPEEIIHKLWDYTQTYTTVGTDGERGTGLGLALCKDFVEKHGGNIWVESQLEVGSDFKFTMPLADSN